MVFVGVDQAEAAAAIKRGSGELKVPAPPSSPWTHVEGLGRRLGRGFNRVGRRFRRRRSKQ
jgi:hypothetical protein